MSERPKFLSLDASIIEDKEAEQLFSDDVKQNRVRFVFPEGFADVPIIEQCRAYCDLENFDVLYDVTMQFLSGKMLQIYLKNLDGKESLLGECHIVDKYQDLRIMQCVADYPVLVYWLVDFVSGFMLKKYPKPLINTATKGQNKKDKSRLAK